jgi:magnesium chelatase subunit D
MSPFDAAGSSGPPSLSDSAYAAILLAVDPSLVGIRVLGWSGPLRDLWVRRITDLRPGAAIRKMPVGISEDRLLGGLDLAATLAAKRAVFGTGILAESKDGFLVLAMAERLSAGIAAHLAAAIDGAPGTMLIALDEGVGPDEIPPAALLDRLAFTVRIGVADEAFWPPASAVAAASHAIHEIDCPQEVTERLCALAAMMGVRSVRAEIFAVRAARAAAALRGSSSIEEVDIALAARLVLVPRATQMPSSEPPPEPPAPPEPEPSPPESQAEGETPDKPIEDKVDHAAAVVLPDKLLEALAAQLGPRRMSRGAGTAGATSGLERGRPAGARPGQLTGRARLSVLDTIRAAAPWQRLRQAGLSQDRVPPARPRNRILVRVEDFHIRQFKEKPRRIAIFAVDASGSSAVNRLAEAKGAILLLLADCYVQRDEVALIAFRGVNADLLLPPTHALARARRALAALPGGGPTPLAAGINAALRLAITERRAGKQPLLVILTDGGANIGQDGKPGRAAAGRDALAAAKSCGLQNLPALVVDTSPRRQKFVAELAGAMDARYVPLPYADAPRLSRAVQAAGGSHGSPAA